MKRLYRCRWDKKIAGVCGGIGHYCNIDPNLIRIAFVLFGILSVFLPIVIIYLICMIVMPEGPKAYVEGKFRKLYRTPRNRKIAGVCGGVAEYLRMDATIVRVIFIILLFGTGVVPVCITYVVAASLVPMKPN